MGSCNLWVLSCFFDILLSSFMSCSPSSVLSSQCSKCSQQNDRSGCYTLMFSGSALTLFGISHLFK